MQYWVGLIVFSSIGSFIIADTLEFYRALQRNKSTHLSADLLRLILLAGFSLVGYRVASETFQKPNDWLVFFLIGMVGAFVIQSISRLITQSGSR